MKRILILTMSCNDSFFENQINIIQKTWAKNLPNNIKWIYYTGDNNKIELCGNHLKLTSEDDLENSFKKTWQAMLSVNTNDFDYLVRTNTSTYINIPLLNEFLNTVNTDDITYAADIYSLSEAAAPSPLDLFPRGNCMILPKKHVDIICKDGYRYAYLEKVDDMIIGNIINSYYIDKKENYLDHIKGIPHGWYKCIPGSVNNGHQLCKYGNSEGGYNFYKDFISIQIKRYRERELEEQHYYEFYNIMNSNTNDSIRESVERAIKYSENPSIFIGSLLGYIDYDKWKTIDKQRLFWIEFSNKAHDDTQYYKYIKWKEKHNIK